MSEIENKIKSLSGWKRSLAFTVGVLGALVLVGMLAFVVAWAGASLMGYIASYIGVGFTIAIAVFLLVWAIIHFQEST